MPNPVSHTPPMGCVKEDIRRLDVLMDKTSLMYLAERPCERDRNAQERRYVQWSAEQPINRGTAGKRRLSSSSDSAQLIVFGRW
jgi:hypothetical protein